jgi:hypothetical protein
VRPSTLTNCDSNLRNHLLPAIGRDPLSMLRRRHIATFVQLVDQGLVPSTVRHCYLLMAMLMRSARYDRLITVSPCYKIRLSTIPGRTLPVNGPAQVHVLLEAAPDSCPRCGARQECSPALGCGTAAVLPI